MDRKTLQALKRAPKCLRAVTFRPLRKRQLPAPLDKLGGPRLQHSGLIAVSDVLAVVFVARDGASLERRAFYAHLLQRVPAGLLPLVILHYHPSHKGMHLLVNCGVTVDYTNRLLPGAPELALGTPEHLDPGSEQGRLRIINDFCARCGIRLAPDDEQLL
jgi:hypothetical protein